MPPESRTALPFLQGLFYDLRFSLRRLRRDKVFTAMAISTLAVAIGLNVTVFAVMDTMLYRGFPLVKRNDRLVYMQEHFPSGQGNISYRDFEDWRSQAHSFLGMGFVAGKLIAFGDQNGRPQDMTTALVSANTFGLLGVPPLLGRDFVPADEVLPARTNTEGSPASRPSRLANPSAFTGTDPARFLTNRLTSSLGKRL